MSYTLDFSIVLGASKTGLTLNAQIVDTAGGDVGAAVAIGFTEIGGGNYLWHYAAFPDGHRGGVKFYESGVPGTILAFAAINPEEAERVDAKVSTRATQTSVDAIKAKTDTIGGADLETVSPVLADGDMEIVQDDDYMDADGRALEWTDTAYTGPIQDGDDAEFALMETADYHAAGGTPALTKAGTAHLVGTTLRIVVELTAAETAALEPSPPDDRMNYTYQVRVDIGSSGSGERQVTAALGSATVKKKVVA